MTVADADRDLYRNLLPWIRSDWPLDWTAVFGRKAPLRLELGFGNGEYLAARASAEPEIDWVGVEISWGSVRRLLRRLENLEITNVRVVHGDGSFLLRKLFAARSLDRVVINHSDPWPKKRHRERRLIQPRLIRDLAERLETGGEVRIATDHAEYAEWISEVLEGQGYLRSKHPAAWIDGSGPDPSTKYMKKGIEAGSVIHVFEWNKVNDVAEGTAGAERVEEMPNVLLEGTLSITTVFDRFEPLSWEADHGGSSVFIHLGRVYTRMNGNECLMEARVKEDGLEQHFAVSVTVREDGKIVVKPSSLGSPRPTWGVKQAVGGVARLLTRENPDLRVLASSAGRAPIPAID